MWEQIGASVLLAAAIVAEALRRSVAPCQKRLCDILYVGPISGKRWISNADCPSVKRKMKNIIKVSDLLVLLDSQGSARMFILALEVEKCAMLEIR